MAAALSATPNGSGAAGIAFNKALTLLAAPFRSTCPNATQWGSCAMFYTLGTAAKASGIAKSTVLRAIRNHRISATRSDTGDWEIDPAELHRVFPAAPTARNTEQSSVDHCAVRGATPEKRDETALLEAQLAGLKEVAELMRRQLDDLRQDRDAWREQAQTGARLLTHEKAAGDKALPWWRRWAS
jgi:hypothetical protein